jgi:hypothetical protein
MMVAESCTEAEVDVFTVSQENVGKLARDLGKLFRGGVGQDARERYDYAQKVMHLAQDVLAKKEKYPKLREGFDELAASYQKTEEELERFKKARGIKD